MTVTLLLDLDDTLLLNSTQAFLPAYIKGLAACMAPYADPQRMIAALMAATDQMARNQQPDRTLEATFDAAFYPALGLEKEALRPTLDAFYAEDFPRLRTLTHPNPQAAALVAQARARGWQIGIATNPLFPRTAIEQRITWAGFSPSDFDLVPSYESFHFAKPNPAFFAEFLAQMGWPDGPVVMVGDDQDNDILPAKQAGLTPYWLHHPQGDGDLQRLPLWIEQASPEALAVNFAEPPAVLAALRATSASLHTLSSSRPYDIWCRRPAPHEWCFTEIACHLRDAEIEINTPRIQAVLNQDNPFLPGQDADTWKDSRRYDLQCGPAALRDFTAARKESLSLLEAIPPEGWLRPARHAIFGPTHLFEIVSMVAEHDRLHVRQAKIALQ